MAGASQDACPENRHGRAGSIPNKTVHLARPVRVYDLNEIFGGQGQRTPISKETLMATMTGTIKRMINDKGFGFIAAGDGTEYFFHQSACTSTRFDDMREGQTVSFTVGQGPKGPRAENVQPA
jgi:CspA family cold shock protein